MNANTKHTPDMSTNQQPQHAPKAPLRSEFGEGRAHIVDADNRDVALVRPFAAPQVESDFAARIVACVNACEGMDDPAVAISGLRSRSDDVPAMCAEVETLRAECAALKAENARLREALELSARNATSILHHLPVDASGAERISLRAWVQRCNDALKVAP